MKYYVYYIILYLYVYLLSFHLIEFLLQIGGHDLIETSGKERWMEVEATNTHPKYSSATFSNDFAIMTLKDEVVFNQVQSILLLRFNHLSDFFIYALKTWIYPSSFLQSVLEEHWLMKKKHLAYGNVKWAVHNWWVIYNFQQRDPDTRKWRKKLSFLLKGFS